MKADTPLQRYQRHIAHANHIIFNKIANELYSKSNENEKEDKTP